MGHSHLVPWWSALDSSGLCARGDGLGISDAGCVLCLPPQSGLAVLIQVSIAGGTFMAHAASGILAAAGLILTGSPTYLYYRRSLTHAGS
jgi:hypothetical protein